MKKGVTLIETVISIGIIVVILSLLINMLAKDIFKYKKVIVKDRDETYCTESLRFIEGEINDLENKWIDVEENSIIIKKKNNDKDVITCIQNYKGNKKIVIIYDKLKNNFRVTNTILEDVKSFLIKQKENIVFINIETNNGKRYERCFGIRNMKKDL